MDKHRGYTFQDRAWEGLAEFEYQIDNRIRCRIPLNREQQAYYDAFGKHINCTGRHCIEHGHENKRFKSGGMVRTYDPTRDGVLVNGVADAPAAVVKHIPSQVETRLSACTTNCPACNEFEEDRYYQVQNKPIVLGEHDAQLIKDYLNKLSKKKVK